MPRVNGKARLAGLRLAVWFWYRDSGNMPHFNYRDLEASNTIQKVTALYRGAVLPEWLGAYAARQEVFVSGYVKPDDRLFGSDVIDAYDWYVSCFRSRDRIISLGMTASDFGLPEDRWTAYLGGAWSCQESVQNCINLACEMTTRDGVKTLYMKALKAFGLHRSVGFMPDAWMGSMDLVEAVRTAPSPEPEDDRPVTCSFTVPAEVAEWLRGKGNASRFVQGLVMEEIRGL